MDKDNHLSTKKDYKTPRPTKWSPPSYEKEREWMKNWEKPTVDIIDEPTYEKEPAYLSWGQNPYNNRERRSQMKAQLKERIDADMQELAALDSLELDETEVSEEDLDGKGVIEAASSHGRAGSVCSSRWSCQSNCCERNRCVEKVRDWANIHYCPSECRGWAFAPTGTC